MQSSQNWDLEEIYRHSRGAARLVNKVCTHCLLYGAQNGKRIIDDYMVKLVIQGVRYFSSLYLVIRSGSSWKINNAYCRTLWASSNILSQPCRLGDQHLICLCLMRLI